MRLLRSRSVLVLAVALALGLLHTAAPCSAADPPVPVAGGNEAARLFAEGQTAFEAADYRRAAAAFEAAYAQKPHHAPLWNAARSWQRAGDEVRSANLLERYLAIAPANAPDRAPATAALTAIKGHVGRLQLSAPPGSSTQLDGLAVEPGLIYVAPGEHVVVGQIEGKAVRRPITVAAGELASVLLESPPPPQPSPPPARVAREEPAKSTRGLPAWTLGIGAGLVLGSAGLATWSGLDTIDKRDAFLAHRTQAGLDTAADSQLRTNVFIATTAVFAVATAALAVFIVDWHSRTSETR